MLVETCDDGGWCDYVFEENYEFLTLDEVALFIKKNGHLPKTPSAAEIEADGGFELKFVALNHQEKIEELFLHLIELNKEADQLERELAYLLEENKKLKGIND